MSRSDLTNLGWQAAARCVKTRGWNLGRLRERKRGRERPVMLPWYMVPSSLGLDRNTRWTEQRQVPGTENDGGWWGMMLASASAIKGEARGKPFPPENLIIANHHALHIYSKTRVHSTQRSPSLCKHKHKQHARAVHSLWMDGFLAAPKHGGDNRAIITLRGPAILPS